MPIKEPDLFELVEKLEQEYPRQFVYEELGDVITIRRRGPAENFKPSDVVGKYAEIDYQNRILTEEKIRTDIKVWLTANPDKVRS
jgi:hypothetical protein